MDARAAISALVGIKWGWKWKEQKSGSVWVCPAWLRFLHALGLQRDVTVRELGSEKTQALKL